MMSNFKQKCDMNWLCNGLIPKGNTVVLVEWIDGRRDHYCYWDWNMYGPLEMTVLGVYTA